MSTERCVLIRCGLPVVDGEPHVSLPSGGKIHFDCLISWRKEGGALHSGKPSGDTYITTGWGQGHA